MYEKNRIYKVLFHFLAMDLLASNISDFSEIAVVEGTPAITVSQASADALQIRRYLVGLSSVFYSIQ